MLPKSKSKSAKCTGLLSHSFCSQPPLPSSFLPSLPTLLTFPPPSAHPPTFQPSPILPHLHHQSHIHIASSLQEFAADAFLATKMHFPTPLLVLLLPTLVSAHARIRLPKPLGAPPENPSGNFYNAPLDHLGSEFPCKNLHLNPSIDRTPTATWQAGQLGMFEYFPFPLPLLHPETELTRQDPGPRYGRRGSTRRTQRRQLPGVAVVR